MTDVVGDLDDLDDSRAPRASRGPWGSPSSRESARRRLRPVERLTAGGVAVAFLGSSAGAIVLGGTSLLAGPARPTAATLAAGSATLARQSGEHVTVHLTISGPDAGVSQTVTVEAAVDNVHRSGDLVTVTGARTLEERFVGGQFYLKLPASGGKPWESYPISSFDSDGPDPGLGDGTDPASSLDLLKRLTGVRDLGIARVDGVSTEHFSGAASLLAPGDDPSNEPADARPYAVEAYIGSDGLVRRISVVGDLPSAGGTTTHVDEVSDFSQFGRPVIVVAPPADQVRSVTP